MNAGIITVKCPPREIRYPTLIGLHYDEFRVTVCGIFSLHKKKVSLEWLNVRELSYLKMAVFQPIKEISIYWNQNFIAVDTTAYGWIYPEPK